MAEESIRVTYDGPAVAEHRMRVRDLAPSMLAAADLFRDAQRILQPDEPTLDVEITASGDGSFFIELVVEIAGAVGAVQQALASGATTASNLRDVIKTVRALLEFIKYTRGNKPSKAVDNGDGTTTLNFQHADNVTVNNNVYKLYLDRDLRRDARDVVRPLEGPRYTTMRVQHDDAVIELTRDDYRESFDSPDLQEEVGEAVTTTTEMIVQIASLAFDDRQWRLDDGDHVFTASMRDSSFMDRVRRRVETFGAGDTLRVRMRITQSIDETLRLHVRREVLEVLAHIRAGINDPFPEIDD